MVLEALLLSRDGDVIRVLRRVAADLGMQLEVCSDSVEAADVLQKRKYDAVVVDCDDMHGATDVLRSIRKTASNRSSTTFALINGATTVGGAFEMGANLALEKPLSIDRATRSFRAAQGLMLAERRRYFRHAVEFPLTILTEEQRIPATTTNISEGGMAIAVSQPLPMSGLVRLTFILPETTSLIEAHASVAWADKRGNAGLRLENASLQLRTTLAKWLADKPQE